MTYPLDTVEGISCLLLCKPLEASCDADLPLTLFTINASQTRIHLQARRSQSFLKEFFGKPWQRSELSLGFQGTQAWELKPLVDCPFAAIFECVLWLLVVGGR